MYSYYGELIRKFDDPQKILAKAKAEREKKSKVAEIFDTITSPLTTVLRKITYKQTAKSTVTDEERVRAIINQVLIEHGLI